MKKDKHPSDETFLTQLDHLHQSLEIPSNRTKETVWAALEQQMKQTEKPQIKSVISKTLLYGIAASIALLIAVGTFLYFVEKPVVASRGAVAACTLPDGSKVLLNQGSRLVYHPYRWFFVREVYLTGEAFFQVTKGKRFSVLSHLGTTTVLGTSFDVYAYDDQYRVVCITGKVEVRSNSSKKVILAPGEMAQVDPAGEIVFTKKIKTDRYMAWTQNRFVFTAEPLNEVLQELSRHYQIQIKLDRKTDAKYTGNFPADLPVEEALSIVCKPFGLTFVKEKEDQFVLH